MQNFLNDLITTDGAIKKICSSSPLFNALTGNLANVMRVLELELEKDADSDNPQLTTPMALAEQEDLLLSHRAITGYLQLCQAILTDRSKLFDLQDADKLLQKTNNFINASKDFFPTLTNTCQEVAQDLDDDLTEQAKNFWFDFAKNGFAEALKDLDNLADQAKTADCIDKHFQAKLTVCINENFAVLLKDKIEFLDQSIGQDLNKAIAEYKQIRSECGLTSNLTLEKSFILQKLLQNSKDANSAPMSMDSWLTQNLKDLAPWFKGQIEELLGNIAKDSPDKASDKDNFLDIAEQLFVEQNQDLANWTTTMALADWLTVLSNLSETLEMVSRDLASALEFCIKNKANEAKLKPQCSELSQTCQNLLTKIQQ